MANPLRYLRIPRPKHFLGIFDLHNGAELILTSFLLNKVSGLYGVIALLTGASISALQLSMYIYSILLATLIIYLSPQVHSRTPIAVITFAYVYLIDSVVNALYTVVFGISWFLVISQKYHSSTLKPSLSGGAGEFGNISHMEVNPVVVPSNKTIGATTITTPSSSSHPSTSLTSTVLQPESATSIMIIAALWLLRFYFILIIFSFAREIVRDSATPTEEPFTGRNGGEGWRGKLGRALVGVNRRYWEGRNGWMPFGAKFKRSEEPGEGRRRRGGGMV